MTLASDTSPLAPAHDPHGTHDPQSALDSHRPLSSRRHLDERIRQLVPCAVQRQLWLLLLDADDVQMPVMIPIGDLPIGAGGPDPEGIVELLDTIVKEFCPASFVFVVERPGSSSLAADDAVWLTHLLRAGDGRSFEIRGAYVCHDDGVSGYDAGDLDDLSRYRHQAVSASSADM